MKYSGSYVLDTSAVIAYAEDEPGAQIVASLFQSAEKGDCQIYVSLMTIMEMCYKAWQEKGEEAARLLYGKFGELPIQKVDLDEEGLWWACQAKALHSLSLADAWIYAAAVKHEAFLVTKDPEFEQVKEKIRLLALPYKK